MEFINRMTSNQPQAQRAALPPDPLGLPKNSRGNGRKLPQDILTLGGHIGTNILLLAVALLIAALAWLTYAARPASQVHLVDGNKLQAVFLNTGQVYFGNISSLNDQYYVLHNVYYLQSSTPSTSTSSKTSNPNLSLIKLGCELHQPYDQMVINSSQVTFWENLQDTGQVAKAVAQFQQQNPNGQKCSNTPASTSSTDSLQSQSGSKSSTNNQ
jgi:hypothetical protein